MKRPEGEPQQKRFFKRMLEGVRRGREKESPPIPELPSQPIQKSLLVLKFEQKAIEQQRQKQELLSQIEEQKRQEQLAKQQRQKQEAEKKARLEQRKRDGLKTGEQICKILEQEVKEQQLDQFAKVIRDHMWENSYSIPIHISTVNNPSVMLEEDGTVKNRSASSIELSYVYRDIVYKGFVSDTNDNGSEDIGYIIKDNDRVKQELHLGIGYFGDRSEIIPEAQKDISDEELEKGVKSLFIQWTYLTEQKDYTVGTTGRFVIPLTYPEYPDRFADYLLKSAEGLAPDPMMENAKLRGRIKKYGEYDRTMLLNDYI